MSTGTNRERIEQNNTLLEDIKTQVQNLPEYQDTSDADAIANDIAMNKTAYVNGEKIIGTMPNNGELNYTPSTEEQTIPAGYTSGGTISAVDASIDENIISENIKSGVTILGVTGTFEATTEVQEQVETLTQENETLTQENEVLNTTVDESNAIAEDILGINT